MLTENNRFHSAWPWSYGVNENGIMFYDRKQDPEFCDALQITHFRYMHKAMAIPYVAANLLNYEIWATTNAQFSCVRYQNTGTLKPE